MIKFWLGGRFAPLSKSGNARHRSPYNAEITNYRGCSAFVSAAAHCTERLPPFSDIGQASLPLGENLKCVHRLYTADVTS